MTGEDAKKVVGATLLSVNVTPISMLVRLTRAFPDIDWKKLYNDAVEDEFKHYTPMTEV